MEFLTGTLLPAVLLLAGTGFAVTLRMFPLAHIGTVVRALTRRREGDGIPPTRALALALAGTLGVGNIVGVASAIALGGFGAIFWMWVSALAAMLLKYGEILLGMRSRVREGDGFRGGAPFYIRETLSKRGHARYGKAAAVVFSGLCLADSLTTGCVVQVNAVARSALGVFGFSPLAVGVFLAILCGALLIRGQKSVERVIGVLVPLMSAGYLLLSLAAMFRNPGDILPALGKIFRDAFSLRGAAGGTFGFLGSRAIRYGTMRGLLSNEAGCGTSPFAHIEAKGNSPVEQGFFGLFEVFADTILLCSATAIVIVMNETAVAGLGADPMMMAIAAYAAPFGRYGSAVAGFLCVSVALFGFATLLCWSRYGVACVRFLGLGKVGEIIYLCVFCAAVPLGAVAIPARLFDLADVAICLMTFLNVTVLVLSRDTIRAETDLYFGFSAKKRKKRKKISKPS